MKEYFNSPIPKLFKADGVVLFKRAFYNRPEVSVSLRLRRHERCHIQQQKEEGFFMFLLNYIKEYIQNLLGGLDHHDAYKMISYEMEARLAENEPGFCPKFSPEKD